MAQNRNKLIGLFIGNISNSVVHKVLEMAAAEEELANKYNKELTTSFEIAKKYREKINPASAPLPENDISHIRNKITSKVISELKLRISKGYENIDLDLVEEFVDEKLKDANVA